MGIFLSFFLGIYKYNLKQTHPIINNDCIFIYFIFFFSYHTLFSSIVEDQRRSIALDQHL